MTDKEFRKLRKKVLRHFDTWLPRFGLENWRFAHNFHREVVPGAESKTMATTTYSSRYMYATVDWNLGSLTGCSAEDVDGVVVHELLHCVLGPLADENEDSWKLEFVTTHLSRILQRTANG